MNCRSGCPTKDHDSYAECLQDANVKIGATQTSRHAEAFDATKKELSAYRTARANGIQPSGTTMAKVRDVRDTKVGTDPEALCEDLATANDVMIANINVALKEALSAGEQGIANYLAERDDMHKKWRWQLEASVA